MTTIVLPAIANKLKTLALVGTLGAGLFFGTAAAHAQPIQLGDGTPCKDSTGASFPEGTIAKDRWGLTYVCISGKWEVSPQALTVSPTNPVHRAPISRASAATLSAQ
jgi:hypothetical protein